MLGRRFVTAVRQRQKYIAIFTREEKKLSEDDFLRISNMRRDVDAKLQGLLRDNVAIGEFEIADERVAALAIGGIVSWAYVWCRGDGRLILPQVADRRSDLILSLVDANSRRTTEAAPLAKKRRTGRSRTRQRVALLRE
jgi:hypothetical protein